MTLVEYVMMHTERSECRCGKCIDAHEGPEPKPTDHTVNMIFFRVSARSVVRATGSMLNDWRYVFDKDTFRRLTKLHNEEFNFNAINPFDGKEHSYIELGEWIGDQGIALQYMAMGVLLGVFDLLTPITILNLPTDQQPIAMGVLHGVVESLTPATAHKLPYDQNHPIVLKMAENGFVCITACPPKDTPHEHAALLPTAANSPT